MVALSVPGSLRAEDCDPPAAHPTVVLMPTMEQLGLWIGMMDPGPTHSTPAHSDNPGPGGTPLAAGGISTSAQLTAMLRQAMWDQQVATSGFTGFPAGGTVRDAVVDSVRDAMPAVDGEATYRVVVSGDGHVIDASVTGTHGGTPDDWSATLQGVQDALSDRQFHMGSTFGNGAEIFIHVRSGMFLPSGNPVGHPVSVSAGPTAGGGLGISGTFDLSDAVAPATWQVRTQMDARPL